MHLKLIFLRQMEGCPEIRASWNDGYFVELIGIFEGSQKQGVTSFMISSQLFLLLAESEAPALSTPSDLVACFLKLSYCDCFQIFARSQQSRLVDNVCKLCA